MKIIVLSANAYKEKDVIVNAISEDEYLSFCVHGGLDNKSKNGFLSNIFTIADVTFSESNKKNRSIKSSYLIDSPFLSTPNLSYMASLSLLSECFKSLLQDEEKPMLFSRLEIALKQLKKANNPYMILINLLMEIIKIAGYELSINGCAICGKKEVVGFSFSSGGLFCKDCKDDILSNDLNIEQMKILRNATISKDLDFSMFTYRISDMKMALNKLLEYIYDCFGVKFKNLELL